MSQEFPPDTDWGGIGTYGGIITPALAKLGVEVHVLSVVPGQDRKHELRDGVHVHRAPLRRPRGIGRISHLPQTWGRASLAAAIRWEARRLGLDFDVVETPEWWAEGLAMAYWRPAPLVVRLHSGAAHVFPHLGKLGVDERLAARCENALIRRADVVTGTRAIIEQVSRDLHLSAERLRPIIYPVRAAEPLSDPEGPPRILFAGRLEPRKGPDVLIRAAPRILAERPDVRFAFLGAESDGPDGRPYGEYLRELARRLGVAEAIEIAGRRGGPETVAQELGRSAICAVPSRWESMGYVAAEAAALGRPVVGSRITALEEIIRDNLTGRLVPADDIDGWSDAILDVLSLPAERRREMGAAGAQLIESLCNPDRVARQTLDAYEFAVQRHAD